MVFPKLQIFLEGDDDKIFFDRVIRPIVLNKYGKDISLIKYSKMKRSEIEKLLKLCQNKGNKLIFVADHDTHPCVSSKKQELKNKYKNLNDNSIVIVKKEIESWYLAGINEKVTRKFKIKNNLKDTHNIYKNDFNKIIEKSEFDSRIDAMQEILKYFDIKKAIRRNDSLKYFINKHINI